MSLNDTIHTTSDVLEIQDHRQLNNQTTYLVTQWSPEIPTQEQIDDCIHEGFQIKQIHSIMHNTGQPTYEVYWKPAWQLDSTIKDCDNGPEALAAYEQ